MISPELIRRYPFFASLTEDNLTTLAKLGELVRVEVGHIFFKEGEHLDRLFLVVEGAVGIFLEIPAQRGGHSIAEQLTRELATEEVVVSALGPGDVFGWSALVPPYTAMGGAKALTPVETVAFPAKPLMEAFKADCRFGFLIMQRIAQVARERLYALRIESISRVLKEGETQRPVESSTS